MFSVEHPIFTAAGPQDWYYGPDGTPLHFPVDRYFEEGQRTARFWGGRGEVPPHPHHLSGHPAYRGFSLRRVVEPKPPQRMMDLPGMKDELRRPMMLLVAAVKQ